MENSQILITRKHNLSSALSQMQNSVIGIFIPNHNPQELELITNVDESTVDTVVVGKLFELQTTWCISRKDGVVKLFPEAQSLADMLAEPNVYTTWYKENIHPYFL